MSFLVVLWQLHSVLPRCLMTLRLCHAPGWPARWVALLVTGQPRGAPLPGGGAKYIILSLLHYITYIIHHAKMHNLAIYSYKSFGHKIWQDLFVALPSVMSLTLSCCNKYFTLRGMAGGLVISLVLCVLLTVERKSIRMIFTILPKLEFKLNPSF